MTKDFKRQAAEVRAQAPRVPVPQVDPDRPLNVVEQEQKPREFPPVMDAKPELAPPIADKPKLTTVDTSERPTNQSFSMYPTRHEQVTRDLSYIERRPPWKIWDDAMEEYVIKHYGKEYRRK